MADPLGLIQQGNGSGAIHNAAWSRASGTKPNDGPSFNDVLKQNLEQVNQLQQNAEMAIEDLVSGRRDDVASVMIAKQKADLAFQMLLQVCNKMLAALEEIKEMRV